MREPLKRFFKSKKFADLDKSSIKSILNNKNVILSPDTERIDRIPPGQHEDKGWPVLHAGSVPKIDVEKWRFEIWGQVEENVELNFQEFMALPKVKVFSDIHCVTSWSRLNNLWEGISTSTIKELVKILPEAKYVLVHAHKKFTTNLSLEDFFASDVILAIKHNNTYLSREHGAPVRLIVPRLYFWKSAKWVAGLEFLAEDKRGFWESSGYHNHGDPWKEERYSWQEKE